MQVRGHSALSADAFKYVQVLLGAVYIVKTCVVDSGLVLGGAISVGSRGQYSVRVFNPLGEARGDGVQSE